ncbi:retrovirus-related pol polyprotein from transposon TNT 1-94 [Tanacetum coccineum]|uniref:Retrovirus-related pol polyprotein from transposon TNT 1-94 n=1 Tax=Tanacetum coccineum TaxID=301880 RepID=A0ABQ4ZPM9_9ASTR
MTDEKWMNVPIIFPPVLARDFSEEALVVEAEVEGYLVQRIHIDEGASIEIMFEHCFNMLHPSIRSRLVETQTTVFGFLGEQVKPLGKIKLDICFGGSGLCRRSIMKFTIISAPSLYNIILGRPGLKQHKSIPSTIYGMMKFPTPWVIATLVSQMPTVFECRREGKKQAIGPPEEEGTQGTAGIVRPVKYPTWISNPVLVKKVDGTWRMCIDFKNINSACPKDYYPLPEIDSIIEAVMGFPLKCFLDAYSYHHVQMAEEDEEKTAFYTDQDMYCYTKEDRESQLYDDFEHFRQHKGETIHDYYVRFAKLINDMRNIKMTMSRMQLNSKFINNMLSEWGRFVTTVKLNRGAASYGGAQNRVGNANPGQARQVKCYNCKGIGHIARNCTQPKHPQNSEYFKDKMLLMQAQENGVALDEEQLLFIAADDCDAFDSDVDEAPTAQTMFMANLSSADPVYDEAGLSYDSDILSEYVKDNAVPIVQSNVSSVPNDAYMMIFNDMHEPHAQSVSDTTRNTVVDNSLTAELATYKEQVELYERRARFELTEREQKIDEQLRIVITDRNIKEENLKKELHSVKMQLASTINHNKSMVEEVTSLKKDFKQKENKYLEEFLDMKALKEKVEDKLYKQDQSLQTVHMLCKPKPYYNEQNKVAIGYKNPLCLTRAKQVQPALYNGYEIIKNNHVPALVHNTEDTLEIAEITRRKMNDKMKDPECVTHKVKIAPPDYSKENYLATFTPQKQLTPEQIFWSQDLIKMKEEALKKQTTASRPIKALTVYPPNTPATLVPRVLPTKSQVKINIFALIQLFSEFEKTCKKRITPTGLTEGERGFEQTKECYLTEVIPFFKTLKEHFEGIQKALTKEIKEMKDIFEELEAEVDQNVVNRKHDEIERKNLLIANDNLIADCLSKEVFYIATNSELTISQLKETRSEADRTLDFRTLDFQITQLTEKVTVLQEQNKLFRAENEKVKQHYKELYDSIMITHAKHIEQTTALLTENENLKAQIHENLKCNTMESVKPRVLAPVGVNCCTNASRSQPRSNTKKNRISPAKGVNKKIVEEHPRINKKHSCYVQDTNGAELIKGSRGSNLYTISVEDMMKSSPICLFSKASKNKSWLWHRRLNHLNFGTINDLARKDLVRGLPRLKFEKDHLCSACQLGKSKKHTHKPKTENTNLEVLNTLHMDLCGPMRVQTINGKKYILVIVDDYSRFTWVKFLRSKDETPEVVIKFLKQIQVGLNKTIRYIRTDNGTEFVNKDLTSYYEQAARTILIFSKAPMFLWAEVVAIACYTENRSLIHTLHNKTSYELVHDKKHDLTFFCVFGAFCYPTNNSEDLGKLQPTVDIGIFIGYAPSRKGYRIYNKRTRRIMETIHVQFDELTEQMALVQLSTRPAPMF